MDVGQIASMVVAVLVPFVKDAGVKLRERLSDAAADEAVGTAAHLLDRVRDLFARDPKTEALVDQFSTAPDERSQRLEAELFRLLDDDPALAREFERLVAAPVAGGTSVGEITMNVYGGTNYGYIAGVQNFGPAASSPPRER